LMETDAHCLHLLGVNAPVFRRPVAEMISDITKITHVDIDFTNEGVQIHAAKTLGSRPFLEALGRRRGGACELLQQLENYPEAVLARQEQSTTSSPTPTRSNPGILWRKPKSQSVSI
jgi:hypothetical protein